MISDPLGGGSADGDVGARDAWTDRRASEGSDSNSTGQQQTTGLKPSLFAEPFTRESGWQHDQEADQDVFQDALTGPFQVERAHTTVHQSAAAAAAQDGLSMTPKHARSASNSAIFSADTPDVYATSVTPRDRNRFPRRRSHDSALANLDVEQAQNMLNAASADGDLDRVRAVLESGHDSFAIVNSPCAHSTLTPLHRAATHGHLHVVKYLVDEAGAVANVEDGDGENALHKAAYNGHLQVVQFLATKLHLDSVDSDGWTALHNACSRGYLDIVRFLVEQGLVDVNQQSKRRYTPLMNAASKGHMPVVRYLLQKHDADPLLRNDYGETAFDLAAGVFEIELCFELMIHEARRVEHYNVLALHSVVPVVVHENQRLAHPSVRRLSSLGQLAQRPRFSAKALTRNDQRAAFTMPKIDGLAEPSVDHLPILRNEVLPPVCGKENVLTLPVPREIRSRGRIGMMPARTSSSGSASGQARGGPRSEAANSLNAVLKSSSTTAEPMPSPHVQAGPSTSTSEPAWFFLSDWAVDLTDPRSSARDGWSYASSFDDPTDRWQPEPPSELRKFLDGRVQYLGQPKWVRRRRWVRLLRRRLDVPDWGFDSTQESSSGLAHNDQDYILRANFAVSAYDDAPSTSERRRRSGSTSEEREFFDAVDLRKAAARLMRAIDILKSGISSDDDPERRSKAVEQLEAFEHQLLLVTADLARHMDDEQEEGSDDEFVYNGTDANDDARSLMTNGRTPSIASAQHPVNDYFASSAPSTSSQLTGSATFRVPTHEQRQLPPLPPRSMSVVRRVPSWEPDQRAPQCKLCERRFTFFLRKHHCRKCGRVVCAQCSSNMDRLDPDEVVREPGTTIEDDLLNLSFALEFRTCDACHAELAGPRLTAQALLSPGIGTSPIASSSPGRDSSTDRVSIGAAIGRRSSSTPLTGSEAGQSDLSAISELADCPVCGTVLAALGGKIDQERHVNECLEAGNGTIANNAYRYLVFTLQPGPLVEQECQICFVEYEVGDRLARLACLDYFHENCIRAWLERGHQCPFHSR